MSKRGLPGFLRRSLRLNTARDDDDDDEDDVANTGDNTDTDNNNDVDADDVYDDTNLDMKLSKIVTVPNGMSNHHNTSAVSTTTTTGVVSRIVSQYPSDRSNDSFQLPQAYPNDNENNNKNYNNSSRSMNSTDNNHLSESWQEAIPSGATYTTTDSTGAPSLLANNNNNSIKKTYREQQYAKILSMDVIQMYELRALAWNGIPIQYRAMVWKLLLGYVPTNGARREITIQRKRYEYQEAIVQYYNENDNDDEDYDASNNNSNRKTTQTMSHHRTVQEQETLRQVLVDVPRTQPQIPLFRNQRIQQSLSRILYIWAIRHPASSYVQGINDLVTPLITIFLADYYINHDSTSSSAITTNASTSNDQQQQFQQLQQVLDGHVMNHCSDERLQHVEADVYWCLTNLLSSIQDHYTADQPGLQRMVGRLEELVYRIDKDLTVHIRDEIGIQFLQFSFKWMNCLLLREFHLKCIFRLWDTYLSEKDGFEDFHVYVCAAFMCQFSHQLQTMTFDELFGFMQDIPTNDWTDTEIEVLLSQAFVLSTLFKGSDAHLTNNSASM